MKAEVRLVDGATMMAKSDSEQWVVMDPGKSSGGTGGAPSPMQYVLMALGSCIAMTSTALLRKRAPSIEALSVELDAERAQDYPRAFTWIAVKFVVRGRGLKEEDVKWAVETARDRFCPVGGMLSKAVRIDYTWEIQPTE